MFLEGGVLYGFTGTWNEEIPLLKLFLLIDRTMVYQVIVNKRTRSFGKPEEKSFNGRAIKEGGELKVVPFTKKKLLKKAFFPTAIKVVGRLRP